MKVGAEPKKIAVLALLLLVAAYLFWANVLSEPGAPAGAGRESAALAAARASAALPQAPPPPPQGAVRRMGSRTRTMDDFRPSMRRRADDQSDPMSIDPMLRLDLLAKVQSVSAEGGSRNLFQFGAPPPLPAPKSPDPKVIPKLPGQDAEPPKEAGPPKAPPPPPINLKYYGYSSPQGGGRKTAFFLDGEDILVAGEGETLKRRYRVVRIGVNSVVVEDTQSKSQQTLPLAEDAVMG
jgi:hypothetical protein